MKKVKWCVWLILGALASLAQDGKDYPVRPLPFTSIQLGAGFWRDRLETNHAVTVWYAFKKCEETGRIDNFAKAGRLMPGKFRGTPFDDSDVYKVMEGAAYVLARAQPIVSPWRPIRNWMLIWTR